MEIIEWEKFDDNHFLKTSKAHYVDFSNGRLSVGAKTLCGTSIPSRNEAEVHGTHIVTCKRCIRVFERHQREMGIDCE